MCVAQTVLDDLKCSLEVSIIRATDVRGLAEVETRSLLLSSRKLHYWKGMEVPNRRRQIAFIFPDSQFEFPEFLVYLVRVGFRELLRTFRQVRHEVSANPVFGK